MEVKNRKKAKTTLKDKEKDNFSAFNPIYFEDERFVYGIHNRLIYILEVKENSNLNNSN